MTAWDAGKVTKEVNGAIFEDFSDLKFSVRLSLTENNGDAEWRISVTPGDDSGFVEWVEFSSVTLPSLLE